MTCIQEVLAASSIVKLSEEEQTEIADALTEWKEMNGADLLMRVAKKYAKFFASLPKESKPLYRGLALDDKTFTKLKKSGLKAGGSMDSNLESWTTKGKNFAKGFAEFFYGSDDYPNIVAIKKIVPPKQQLLSFSKLPKAIKEKMKSKIGSEGEVICLALPIATKDIVHEEIFKEKAS